ncbi:MAG: chemotaxis protein CheA [Burkholderiales bacterium RIFCSPLOWO2_02_FULL_57_36]|nr:MAG: chemotaxis protein CheA [Burkholderiales bacterium RIFCSPLOWO2_02_FULL_57_36]
MTIDMRQFYGVFFDETDELLAEMEKLLLVVDVAAPDAEHLNAIFRAAHSIKGGAATFGIDNLIDLTHLMETLLDRIRKGEMVLTIEHVDAFLSAKDMLKMQLDGHRLQTPVDLDAVADARKTLQSLSEQSAPSASPSAEPVDSASVAAVIEPKHQRFRIELPLMPEGEVDVLAAELGLLGEIDKSALDGKRFVLSLSTVKTADDIIQICAFMLEPHEINIVLDGESAPAANQAADEAEQGYGLFEMPNIPNAEQPAAASNEDDQGYGFFEPMVPFESRGVAESSPKESIDDFIQDDPSSIFASTGAHTDSGEPSDRRSEAKYDTEKTGGEASSIRVSIEKVDQLINLVGELVITQAMIEQRTDSLDPLTHERLLNSVNQLTRNTKDLQEAVMSIRMMPMDYVFSRFPRMVRALAGKLGKKVDFITHGAATELDKGLIERIVDPLTHLVRNSIDHGIEMPEVRRAAGKGDIGKLSLSASHQGGNIIIEVSDDGAGLNRDKILAKAAQQGIELPDDMSDNDVWQLIFAPGFSTAEIVTDVSGRGVGMDVVKRNITAMGGVVDIRSLKGFGTTISVSLPLTLAILDGMSVKVGDEVYILPLGYVLESLQPAPIDVKDISGQGRVIKVRGEYLPLIMLYQIFGIEPRFTHPSEGIAVILESDGRKAALLVDDLVGQQQVVVKNIESNYRKIAGISGATILGDGGVSLIIDVAALLRSSRRIVDETIYSL